MYHTRPITESEKKNFDTLVSAAKSDRICLVSTFDTNSTTTAIVVCAVNPPMDTAGDYEFVPLARLFDENPYDRYEFPAAETEESPCKSL